MKLVVIGVALSFREQGDSHVVDITCSDCRDDKPPLFSLQITAHCNRYRNAEKTARKIAHIAMAVPASMRMKCSAPTETRSSNVVTVTAFTRTSPRYHCQRFQLNFVSNKMLPLLHS